MNFDSHLSNIANQCHRISWKADTPRSGEDVYLCKFMAWSRTQPKAPSMHPQKSSLKKFHGFTVNGVHINSQIDQPCDMLILTKRNHKRLSIFDIVLGWNKFQWVICADIFKWASISTPLLIFELVTSTSKTQINIFPHILTRVWLAISELRSYRIDQYGKPVHCILQRSEDLEFESRLGRPNVRLLLCHAG